MAGCLPVCPPAGLLHIDSPLKVAARSGSQALFGQGEADYDEDYNAVFRDSIGGPPGDGRYAGRHALAIEAEAKAKAAGKSGLHPFQRLGLEGRSAPKSATDGQTTAFLKDLNGRNAAHRISDRSTVVAGTD